MPAHDQLLGDGWLGSDDLGLCIRPPAMWPLSVARNLTAHQTSQSPKRRPARRDDLAIRPVPIPG